MTYIIPEFMEMKRKILEHIVEAPVDYARFRLSQLNIVDSGLGLFDSDLTSHAAYVASLVESMCEFVDSHRSDISEDDLELQCFQDLFSSLHVLKKYDSSISLDSLVEKFDKGIADKLQHQISQTFRKSLRLEVYFNSIRDEDAGKLLDMAPKTNMHRSENHNFIGEVGVVMAVFVRILTTKLLP